jgi:hypothetical protein
VAAAAANTTKPDRAFHSAGWVQHSRPAHKDFFCRPPRRRPSRKEFSSRPSPALFPQSGQRGGADLRVRVLGEQGQAVWVSCGVGAHRLPDRAELALPQGAQELAGKAGPLKEGQGDSGVWVPGQLEESPGGGRRVFGRGRAGLGVFPRGQGFKRFAGNVRPARARAAAGSWPARSPGSALRGVDSFWAAARRASGSASPASPASGPGGVRELRAAARRANALSDPASARGASGGVWGLSPAAERISRPLRSGLGSRGNR